SDIQNFTPSCAVRSSVCRSRGIALLPMSLHPCAKGTTFSRMSSVLATLAGPMKTRAQGAPAGQERSNQPQASARSWSTFEIQSKDRRCNERGVHLLTQEDAAECRNALATFASYSDHFYARSL